LNSDPVVQAAVFLVASRFVLMNTRVDIFHGTIDFRIRYT
jgi:ABC-type dipeptide/oligopeptide/nickel transport system permease component